MADETQPEPPPPDAEILVCGEHVTEADPEVAIVVAELSARARRRDDVFERLRERAEWQRGILDRFADQIERDEMADNHVHPIVDRAASEMPVGYVGEIRTRITVKHLGSAGDLVSALALGDMCEIVSLDWALRPTSAVHRATRIAAVHDALAKARDYCSAVGSQLTSLVSIAEASGLPRDVPAPATRLVPAAGQVAGALFDFRPVPVVVRSFVEARFTILQPKFA